MNVVLVTKSLILVFSCSNEFSKYYEEMKCTRPGRIRPINGLQQCIVQCSGTREHALCSLICMHATDQIAYVNCRHQITQPTELVVDV